MGYINQLTDNYRELGTTIRYPSLDIEVLTDYEEPSFYSPGGWDSDIQTIYNFEYDLDGEKVYDFFADNSDFPEFEGLEDDEAFDQYLYDHIDELIEKYYDELSERYEEDAIKAAEEEYNDPDRNEPDPDSYWYEQE